MHITVSDQTADNKPAVMCIERSVPVCIIIHAVGSDIDTLTTLAQAIGVDEVYLLAKPGINIDTLRKNGWQQATKRTLLMKKV